jgi:hypothetical protein
LYIDFRKAVKIRAIASSRQLSPTRDRTQQMDGNQETAAFAADDFEAGQVLRTA